MKRIFFALALLPVLLGAAESEDPVVAKLRSRAMEGLAGAQFNLAELYANGYSVTKDPVEAASWYRKSAEQGYGEAELSLGVVYLKGIGLPKDEVEGLAWLILASRPGNVRVGKFRAQVEQTLEAGVIAAAQRRAKELLAMIEANKRTKPPVKPTN